MNSPWLKDIWQRLWLQHQSGKLPHAILLIGAPNIGKTAFATQFATALLCTQPYASGEPCGVCQDCRLSASEVHPNIFKVLPEKAGQAIKVDQVREANEFVQQSSFKGKTRVVIVNPANALNVNAANALLKTLEEPPEDALLLLVCDQLSALPATIRSRCQQWVFRVPRQEISKRQLEAYPCRTDFYAAMLGLMQKKSEPISSAQRFQKEEITDLLALALSLSTDLMKYCVSQGSAPLLNEDQANTVEILVKQINLSMLNRFVAQLAHWQKQFALGLQLNKTLVLETLFYRWLECRNA